MFSHPSSSKTGCTLNFIPTDLSLTTDLYIRWYMTYSLKIICVTIKIKLTGFGIIHNQHFKCSLFSEFDHLTRFGVVKFLSHVLCPFGDLLADVGESWKTSETKNYFLFYFPYVKFYVSIWCAAAQHNKHKMSLARHDLAIRTFYHN